MLDRRLAQALYRQLADLVRDQIMAGELPPGSEMPSEVEIARHYGASRDVVRQAIAALRSEGLVVTARGRRTMVRLVTPPAEVRVPVGARIGARMPSAAERLRLDLVEGVPVLVVQDDDGEEMYAADRVVVRTVLEPR